jgi:nitrogen fixation protein FixH
MTRPLTGRSILLVLVLFFGAIIAVNTVFIVQSIATFRGEDQQSPYQQGIDYNNTLAKRAEQVAFGWQATLDATRTAKGAVEVTTGLRDKAGAPVASVFLVGELRHPADSARDRPIALKDCGVGLYCATIADVSPGLWDIIVRTNGAKSAPFEASRRLWLR